MVSILPHHFDRVLMIFDYLRIEGWFVSPEDRVVEILVYLGEQCLHRERSSVRLPSPDLETLPPPHDWRFAISCFAKDIATRPRGELRFVLASGRTITVPLPTSDEIGKTPAGLADEIRRLLVEGGAKRVLDVGSRARTGVMRRAQIEALGDGFEYWGVDVLDGDNVDQVVDAHELSTSLGTHSFDAVISHVVFEHLAMPWKVALEMNRVLRPGGLMYVQSVQTCGMHDLPWDFWRFSDSAYRALFNRSTGFEVLALQLSVPMHVFPFVHHAPYWNDAEKAAGFYNAEVIARKIADTALRWPVPLSDVIDVPYPA